MSTISRSARVASRLKAAVKTYSWQPLLIAPMHGECKISVVIPVRDEAESLDRVLAALAAQVDFSGQTLAPNQFEIVILANNCRDNSAEIARRWQNRQTCAPVHVVETNFAPADANIGHARRTAMELAQQRFERREAKRSGIIATTDGDTLVAPDWIWAILTEIGNGAEAVGGRILIDKAELATLDWATRAFYLRDAGYRLLAAELEGLLDAQSHDCLPRHHQHFNASFAVTTVAYKRAGGLPQVKFLEDSAFYQVLRRIDARIRHSPLVRVTTSARRSGRTACGLSTQLQEWTQMGRAAETYFVAGALELETKFRAQRQLRTVWRQAAANNRGGAFKIVNLAQTLEVEPGWLHRAIVETHAFGALIELVETEQTRNRLWRAEFPLVDVKCALHDLRFRLNALRNQSKNRCKS